MSSPVYAAPLNVSIATTIKAIAIDANGRVSEVQAQRYTFVPTPPSISISPNSGNYFNAQQIVMTAASGAAPYTIFYTTDGTTPTVNSATYTAPFNVSTATTIKAIARDARGTFSAVASRSYTFNIPPPVVTASPEQGNYITFPQAITLTATSPRPPVVMYYTTDSSAPTTNSQRYTSPFNIGQNGAATTVRVLAIDSLGQVSNASFRYTFLPIPDIWIYFKKPAGWANTVKIHYWNCVPAGIYANTVWNGVAMERFCGDWYRFRFTGGVTFVNIVINDGAGRQTVDLNRNATGYYDNGWLATPPSISTTPTLSSNPASPYTGTAAFTATITAQSCVGTPTVYYTTDGTTPTLTSTSAPSPLALNITRTTTVKAFARDDAGNQSSIETYLYNLPAPQNQAPVITVNPAGPLTVTGSVNVRISANDDSGIAPKLYYTTDGSNPTTRSDSATSFRDLLLTQSTILRVMSVDNQGLASAIQQHVYTVRPSSLGNVSNVPTVILHQNRPNPTDGNTWFLFETTKAADFELNLYDVFGRKIKQLANGKSKVGENFIPAQLADLPKGIYLYELKIDNQRMVKKLVKQ
jgi:hypothetical protein